MRHGPTPLRCCRWLHIRFFVALHRRIDNHQHITINYIKTLDSEGVSCAAYTNSSQHTGWNWPSVWGWFERRAVIPWMEADRGLCSPLTNPYHQHCDLKQECRCGGLWSSSTTRCVVCMMFYAADCMKRFKRFQIPILCFDWVVDWMSDLIRATNPRMKKQEAGYNTLDWCYSCAYMFWCLASNSALIAEFVSQQRLCAWKSALWHSREQ